MCCRRLRSLRRQFLRDYLFLLTMDIRLDMLVDLQFYLYLDEEIKAVAEKLGLKVPFLRPEKLASDTATTSDVIVHALKFYENLGRHYEIVVLLQPTSPLRTVQNVKDCLALYTSELDMVTTVKESSVSAVLCKENLNGFLEQVIGGNNVRRQDAEKLYEYNGAVYVINAEAVKEKGLDGFTKIKKCVMAEENSVDIDTMLDWQLVENIMCNIGALSSL